MYGRYVKKKEKEKKKNMNLPHIDHHNQYGPHHPLMMICQDILQEYWVKG